MKKKMTIGILSWLVACLFTTVEAQTSIGLKGGVFIGNSSSDIISDVLPMDWEVGPEIGIYLERNVGNDLSVVSGFNYSKRGFSLNQGFDFDLLGINVPIGISADVNLHYLEVPLALKYKIGEGRTKFYGMAGVSNTYAIKGSLNPKAKLFFDIPLGQVDIDFTDDSFTRWNISGMAGIGVEHEIKSGRIFADISYKHGLNSVLTNTIVETNTINKGFSLGFGYAMYL